MLTNPIDYINASNISVLASLSEGGAPPLDGFRIRNCKETYDLY